MGVIYSLIAIFFLIYLVLRIVRMLSPRSRVAVDRSKTEAEERFSADRFNTAPLPAQSAEETAKQLASQPTEWVTYNGMTPPLRLNIRGQSYESYRRVARVHIDVVGQKNMERFSEAQIAGINNLIVADAYVTDWEGAKYPNGNPMPFSPQDLAVLLSKDEHLLAFVSREAKRISPPWPTS
jgi:hypothetical protein